MEPLDDRELNTLLKEWRAPNAPVGIRAPQRGWSEVWDWLVRGSIRVPVPVALAAAAVIALAIWWGLAARRIESARPRSVTFTDFQPVEPKVIRSGYENR